MAQNGIIIDGKLYEYPNEWGDVDNWNEEERPKLGDVVIAIVYDCAVCGEIIKDPFDKADTLLVWESPVCCSGYAISTIKRWKKLRYIRYIK